MKSFLVIIPLCNKETTIERCLQSVLQQSFESFDVVVINDGSTDNSATMLEGLVSDKVELIHQENKGVSATRNLGIEIAIKNKYQAVALLDADDYWMENHLSNLHTAMTECPEATVVTTNYRYQVGHRRYSKTKFSFLHADHIKIVEPFFEGNYFNAVMTSSSIAINLKNKPSIRYDEKLTHTEDTDFMIRAAMQYRIAFNPVVSVTIDQSAPQRSDKIPMAQQHIMDFDQYESKVDEHSGLKKFLDINRFSIAIGYRLQNDIKNAALYQHKIDPSSLTKKQQQLLTMTTRQLKALKRTQKILGNLGFRIRTGR